MDSVLTNLLTVLITAASPSPSPSPSPTDFVSKIRGEYGIPEALTWVIVVVVILGALVVVLKNAKDLLESSEKLHGYWQKLVTFFQGDPAKQATELRADLLKRLRREVDRRLKDSLIDQIWMDVQVQKQAEAVRDSRLRGEHPVELIPPPQRPNFLIQLWTQVGRSFRPRNQPEEKLDTTQPISEVFDRSNGRLLILGDPGSGKTTELLKLAQQLIEQAEEDPTKPIPVIFELSAWKGDRQPIEQWLVAQLKEIYNVPNAISLNWLESNQLLPLLDGLDELTSRWDDRRRQIDCAVAINDFALSNTRQKLVVCCRQQDYKEGCEQGRVRLDSLKSGENGGAVRLQPLSDTQIEKYLEDLNLPQIWERIQQQSELKDLAKSPLFLSMMVLACQKRQIANRSELFAAYIEEQFNKRLDYFRHNGARQINNDDSKENHKKYPEGEHPYKREKATHYLKVLATQLKAESRTEFLIETIQFNWISESMRMKLNYIGLSFCIFMLSALSWVTLKRDFFKDQSPSILETGLTALLVVSMLIFVPFIEVFDFTKKIFPARNVKWSWSKARANFIKSLVYGTSVGIALGLVAGLTSALNLGGATGAIVGFLLGCLVTRVRFAKDFANLEEIRSILLDYILPKIRNFLNSNAAFLAPILNLIQKIIGIILRFITFSIVFTVTLVIGYVFGAAGYWGTQQSMGLFGGLLEGIINGFLLGSTTGFILIFMSWKELEEVYPSFPNRGIKTSLQQFITLLATAFLCFTILGTAVVYLFQFTTLKQHPNEIRFVFYSWSVSIGMLLGLMLSWQDAPIGNVTIFIRHSILRCILWLDGSIPWNYARFLDYVCDLRFIHRVGGRYRFVHDLLREHFVEMGSRE